MQLKPCTLTNFTFNPGPYPPPLLSFATCSKRATLFEPEQDRVVVRTPGYYSVGGRRCTIDN